MLPLTHENILEACVVGVPHPKWDERPLLFLITKDGNRNRQTRN